MRPSRRNRDTSEQQLWIARWGTQTALVWANTIEWAEERVRRRVFDRWATDAEIMREGAVVNGPVTIRLATPADIKLFDEQDEQGGRLPHGVEVPFAVGDRVQVALEHDPLAPDARTPPGTVAAVYDGQRVDSLIVDLDDGHQVPYLASDIERLTPPTEGPPDPQETT